MKKQRKTASTRDGLKILDRITGNDPQLREEIATAKLNFRVARLIHDARVLKYLITSIGPDHVLLGTDFPAALSILSSRIGSMTAEWEHFSEWKKINSEGEEGKFYLWTSDEIKEILGNDSEIFIKSFNVKFSITCHKMSFWRLETKSFME